jgi:Domain of unknown function (DUF4166)
MGSLYQRLLGSSFDRLAAPVQQLHSLPLRTRAVWQGQADVTRGDGLIAGLLGWVLRLPAAGPDQPLVLTLTPEHGCESWERRFGLRVFRSHQCRAGGQLIERIGPVTLAMTAYVADGALCLRMERAWAFGLMMPRLLTPVIVTRETSDRDRYRFDVAAHLPGVGLVVRYAGWLEPLN